MSPSNKSLYLELEETFLRIISTLPMSDAQELLQQCLSFSTRNVEDCPHLFTAFNTWFRRAARPPQTDLCQKVLMFMLFIDYCCAVVPLSLLRFQPCLSNIVHINKCLDRTLCVLRIQNWIFPTSATEASLNAFEIPTDIFLSIFSACLVL